MEEMKFNTHPAAKKENIILGDKYRITMLTKALVRLEYNESGHFVDEATQIVINRDFAVTEYEYLDKGDCLEIVTENIMLYYDKKKFSENGLSIKVKGTNMHYNDEWHYGMAGSDLRGTARTLDNANGEIPLESGIISRQGFAVLDDSSSLVLTNDFVKPRDERYIDIYVFCYGHKYREALSDFYYLCGNTPLLPRYALGNWWSRYYKYTEETYTKLMDSFVSENVPFSVAVIDMDWHLVDIDKKYGSGWTGYSWNKKFFENPKRFLENLHERGMKVTLNVHPAEGVRGFEDCYESFAEYMGKNVEREEPVEFDCSDKKFIKGYFECVHHPLERDGVDFWWVDWQQGNGSKMEGLDPLWILNHYHFLDNGKNGNRALTFSRYAGAGSHRYPVGFSGDTYITWESLDFQPYFTANASNIGYGWWSHDIGGHMLGQKDNELELRWYQFGVFSPIMRLHSSCNDFSGKEPWNYPLEIHAVMNEFLRLRHRLIPYLYTMNYLSYKGRPLISPMYYDNPEDWDAYVVRNQYYFGTEMIVAPITTPDIKGVNMGRVKVWLPKGRYFDVFTDTVYEGDRFIYMYRDHSSIPVLAKEGAIIPVTDEILGKDFMNNPKNLTVSIYPGKNNCFSLYEDDGCTRAYEQGDYVITAFDYNYSEGEFIIRKPVGNIKHLPDTRNLKLEFMCVDNNEIVVYKGDNAVAAAYGYDEESHTFIVLIENWDYTEDITVKFRKTAEVIPNNIAEIIYDILNRAEIEYMQKEHIYRAIKEGRSKEYILSELSCRDIDYHTAEAVREILLAY
ncbi:MAG: glycoside hydrolase family 31 protein [Lachnospiraceae bacterium]|nr:glycoside hydrolase family 31 protein [Lachnospiraceae bacterium]